MTAAESLDPDSSLWHAMAFHLRYERTKRGLSQSQMGLILGVNKFAVSNLEAGRNKLTHAQAQRLDKEWDTGGLYVRWRNFAKRSFDPDWRALVDRYQREATQIRIFHNNLIPIPFQTEDYARSLLAEGHAAGQVDDVEAAVARRMSLQAAILQGRSRPPLIWAVLDEVALRPMGGAEVMRPQLAHIAGLGRLHHVSVRVLQLSAAPHVGIDGSFCVFDLPGHHRAAFAGTTLNVGRVIDDQTEAMEVAIRFDRIAVNALNEEQTRGLLARMCEDT